MAILARRPTWTIAEALEAGCAFVATFQRRPTHTDTLSLDLPYWQTIVRLFGSLAAFQALLPLPRIQLLTPRRCLKCDEAFQPAHKDLHLCDPCKHDPAFRRVPDWLGVPVALPYRHHRR